MGLKKFVEEICEETGSKGINEGEKITGAVFHLLSARITRAEAKDLTSQLPADIRDFWDSVAEKEVDVVKIRKEEFLEALMEKAGLKDAQEAEKAACAVFSALKKRISPGEARDVAAQLPAGLKKMWGKA